MQRPADWSSSGTLRIYKRQGAAFGLFGGGAPRPRLLTLRSVFHAVDSSELERPTAAALFPRPIYHGFLSNFDGSYTAGCTSRSTLNSARHTLERGWERRKSHAIPGRAALDCDSVQVDGSSQDHWTFVERMTETSKSLTSSRSWKKLSPCPPSTLVHDPTSGSILQLTRQGTASFSG
jgi:hypothetical protein